MNPAALDARDTRIPAELQADARLTMAELGRRAHPSQPAVTEASTAMILNAPREHQPRLPARRDDSRLQNRRQELLR